MENNCFVCFFLGLFLLFGVFESPHDLCISSISGTVFLSYHSAKKPLICSR